MTKQIGYTHNKFTNVNCLFHAIQKDGRTLDQIIEDVKKEKALELEVIHLNDSKNGTWSYGRLARFLKVPESKVKHILKFDALGLSYRKLNDKP